MFRDYVVFVIIFGFVECELPLLYQLRKATAYGHLYNVVKEKNDSSHRHWNWKPIIKFDLLLLTILLCKKFVNRL